MLVSFTATRAVRALMSASLASALALASAAFSSALAASVDATVTFVSSPSTVFWRFSMLVLLMSARFFAAWASSSAALALASASMMPKN